MNSKNKPAMTTHERSHVGEVKLLPCSVCDQPGPSEAHEIKQGLWFTSIALCASCHRGDRQGIHGEKITWRIMKMEEIDALNITIKRLVYGR